MKKRPFSVTVDGPAAAGKGTLAQRIADRYGFAHLDTGTLYRGVAWLALETGADPSDDDAVRKIALSSDLRAVPAGRIRTDEVSRTASIVAASPAVRAALLRYQRQFVADPPGDAAGTVLDGRDTGTVVCPDADIKFFITASLRARARRRREELCRSGPDPGEAAVRRALEERDERDRRRMVAPLVPAADAVLIDTTHLSISAAFAVVCRAIDRVPDG